LIALRHFAIPIPSTPETTPLAFFHFMERLKTTPREGWRRFRIGHGESIADHMYRMAIMTMLAPPTLASQLNIPRCTKMALIHDMAEALVGDITPMDQIPKDEKNRREAATMDFLTQRLLGGSYVEQAADIQSAWWEYEKGETKEAMFVKDVDKIELVLQMVDYERKAGGELDLGEFAHVATGVKLPEMRDWAKQILLQREQFWSEYGNKTRDGNEPQQLHLRKTLD
jgi:putative hydrolase of HD superfamily